MRYTGLLYTPQYVLLLSTTFSNNIKGMTEAHSMLLYSCIFLTLSIPNISDKNKLLEANSIEPKREFLKAPDLSLVYNLHAYIF